MTKYNERLDDVINGIVAPAWLQQVHKTIYVPSYQLHLDESKQAITSLIKELVEEAKPLEMSTRDSTDEWVRAYRHGVNDSAQLYHQNIKKILGE